MSIASSGSAAAVTPSNTVDLPGGVTRGLYVGASGDVNADMEDGTTVLFTAMAAGIVHPLRVARVRSTSTTATGIVALY